MGKPKAEKLEDKIALLEAELTATKQIAVRFRDEVERAEAREREASQRHKTSHETIAELKRLLHESELRAARMAGYAARVNESDDANSEMIVVEDREPRRVLRTQLARGADHSIAGYMTPMRSDDRSSKHWTSL